jgi:hypothetical protein
MEPPPIAGIPIEANCAEGSLLAGRQCRRVSNLYACSVTYDARVPNGDIHHGHTFAGRQRKGLEVCDVLLGFLPHRVISILQAEVELAIPFVHGAQFYARDVLHLRFCQ